VKRARPRGKKKEIITEELPQIEDTIETEDAEAVNSDDDDLVSIIDEIQTAKRQNNNTKQVKKQKPKAVAKKKKMSFGRFLLVFFISLLLIITIGMGFDIFDDEDILAPLEDGKINVLLLGVDESGLRTDAIMVASYDVNNGEVNMLSVPRDTKTYIVNRKEFKKINGIHAIPSGNNDGKIYGVEATAEAVTGLTGIPINYYIEFSFLSIDHLFDKLGPVEYNIPDIEGKGRGMNYDDPYQNLHIHLEPGMQELSGNQVQQFLRYRKSNYHVGTGSDTDRVTRQQEFLKSVIEQKINMAVIPKLPGIYIQLSKEIKTNISMTDVTRYIRYVNRLSSDKIHSYSLPGESKMISGASYFVCNIDETKKLVSEVFGYNAEISEKLTISGTNCHEPLKAGNMTKGQDSSQDNSKIQTDKKNNDASKDKTSNNNDEKNAKSSNSDKETPAKKTDTDDSDIDDVTEEEENKIPEPEPNKTPLEEIYNLDE